MGPFPLRPWFARMIAKIHGAAPQVAHAARPKLMRVAPASDPPAARKVLPEFCPAFRDQLGERVRRADGLDLAHVRLTSPVKPPAACVPLGTYFTFILAHDRPATSGQARNVRTRLA